MPKMIFGKLNYDDLKVEVPNGISSPFGKTSNFQKMGAGNRQDPKTEGDWGDNSNRSGE